MNTDQPLSLATLRQGQCLVGTVKKVTLSGAIIDVGAGVDGLLHVSDLGQKQLTRASDLLAEGQEVTVWVKRLDLTGGRLSLTLAEPAKFTWADLQPGLKTEGKVVRLESFGAFVDIGAEADGLVHVSEMGPGRIGKPSDVTSEGAVVTVWVKEADRKTKRISLSMMEPPAVDIRTLRPDAVLTGTVVRLENYGAFVDIGAGRDGMIHVTEMGRGYVRSPSEILSVGDQVQVKVLEVDPRRGRISLSMKDVPAERYQPEDEEDAGPSSMELALRAAMEDGDSGISGPRRDGRRRRKQKQWRSDAQDDIISRTLRERRGA